MHSGIYCSLILLAKYPKSFSSFMNTAYNPTNIVQDGIFCFLIQDLAIYQKISHNFSDAEKKRKKDACPGPSRMLNPLFYRSTLFILLYIQVSHQMLTPPGSWEHTLLVLISINCLHNFLSNSSLMNLSLS